MIGPLLVLLFMNDLPDILEALTLLFADDVKMVTPQTQNINPHSSLIAAWDWSQKWDLPTNPTKCNYHNIGREDPLRLSSDSTPTPVSKLLKDLGVQTDNVFSPFSVY